jgi:hypothetical protein
MTVRGWLLVGFCAVAVTVALAAPLIAVTVK